MGKAIATHQSRRASLITNLANRNITEKEKTLQKEELGRIDATLDDLRTQRSELAIPDVGGNREIGSDEAHDVSQMLGDARTDLSHDFSEIMRKYCELESERTRIHGWKNQLQAREEWLKNNPYPAN